MKAGTRFSARVLIFSAISGLVLTNTNLLTADDSAIQIHSSKPRSARTERNPQKTLINAIQREMHSAHHVSQPRVRFPQKTTAARQTTGKPAEIQQVGFTLDPLSIFQKRKKGSEQKQPQQKRQVIVPGSAQSTAPQYKTAVPLGTPKPGQSEIQRQLEALYRRDGRQMPPMSLQSLPKTANSGSGAGRGTVNAQPAAPAQAPAAPQNVVVQPQPQLPPKPEERKWYDKFLPGKSKQTPKRLSQSHQVAKKAPVDAPAVEETKSTPLPPAPQLPAAPAPQSVVNTPEPATVQEATVAKSVTPAQEELDEEAREELEEAAEEAAERLEEQKIAAEKAEKMLKEKAAELPLIIEKKTAEVVEEKVAKNPEDDFNDLFPDMSEEEADNIKKPAADAPETKTPFSGLVLEEKSVDPAPEKTAAKEEAAPEKSAEVAQEAPAKEVNPFEPQPQTAPEKKAEENPFEVPAPQIAETEKTVQPKTPEVKDNPFKPEPEPKLDAPAPQPEKQVAKTEQDSTVEKKMALIASRGNIKGLKGFCPVALRDNRLLVDARPEFSSSYKSMNYQFASLENKLKFDREPAKYAPAAGGSDIVILVDHQDDKEGTLDFASWYKGRLYLFSSKKNMDVFMKTPALYVGVE
ncbi:YHS domain protein [Gimesia panareensis]|uniref:YHS domain protein n=1 Tax=Gimesia panareensis TaxID=2527978 RepID=A0A518FPD9_9PLAN|nr:hypothetical protein [Gimesia panareensis]QDV18170.1 YHS domain protein [Gimesia panareensis]